VAQAHLTGWARRQYRDNSSDNSRQSIESELAVDVIADLEGWEGDGSVGVLWSERAHLRKAGATPERSISASVVRNECSMKSIAMPVWYL
jgi:hypothetical protein